MLSDVMESDGTISRACPTCVALELVDVVRQLHVGLPAKRRVA
jgi:hypothetical protein